MAVWKVAPALAAGCPVVLKPSEYTPLSALLLAKVAAEAGLPRGVLNVVPGRGETVGAALAASGGVAKVTFTGSTRAGAAVAATAAATAKAVSLELGGKSSDSVWDVLVPRLAEALASLPMGDPLDPSTRLGPLANAVQHAGVSGFIRRAREAGLPEITCSAKQVLPEGGFFVRPAVFGPVPSDAEVWQSEVFGPVLCAQRFTSESQAMEAANNTPYGLAAAVFTERQDVWER
ncbi:BADH2, partial [Symbiodinium sp. KB8]